MIQIHISTLWILLIAGLSLPVDRGPHIDQRELNQRQDEFANSDEMNLSEIRFVCRDEWIRPFWIDLLKEKWVIGQIFGGALQEEYDCSEMLRSTEIDVNDDGKNEIAIRVQVICGTKGNCPFAIYGIFDDERAYMRTSSGTYDFSRRQLLFSPAVLNYEVKSSKHFGYRDILLRFNLGLYGSYLEIHQFDGNSYQRSLCFDEDVDARRSPTECWTDDD